MKQATRVVSLFLACVLSLCLLTACGGGGGGSASTVSSADQKLLTSVGCSASIKKDSDLQSGADIIADAFKVALESAETEDDVQEKYYSALTGTSGVFDDLDKKLAVKGVTSIVCGLGAGETADNAESIMFYWDSNGNYAEKILPSVASQMNYYGVSRVSVTRNDKIAYLTVLVLAH